LKTIGHSLKNLGPSQKTLRHPWFPKLVTGLFLNHLLFYNGVQIALYSDG